MFVESAFITREFREEQIPILENVTCLSVINTGESIVIVNGVTINPAQIQVLISPDGTFSRVQLEVKFLEKEAQSSAELAKLIKGDENFLQSQNPKSHSQSVQSKILLIYKKLI